MNGRRPPNGGCAREDGPGLLKQPPEARVPRSAERGRDPPPGHRTARPVTRSSPSERLRERLRLLPQLRLRRRAPPRNRGRHGANPDEPIHATPGWPPSPEPPANAPVQQRPPSAGTAEAVCE